MMVTVAREKQSLYLSVTFLDQNGEEIDPDTASFTIIEETTKQIIVEDEDFDVLGSSVEIEIDESFNNLLSEETDIEERICIVTYKYANETKTGILELPYVLLKDGELSDSSFCNVSQVKLLGGVADEVDNDLIEYFISYATKKVKLDTERTDLDKNDLNVIMATVIATKMFLKSSGYIDSSDDNIKSYSDGDISINYYDKTSNGKVPLTLDENYDYYISGLREFIDDFYPLINSGEWLP